MTGLKGKKALITGASSGIGLAIAKKLSSQGVKVCINFSKSKDKAEKVKKEILDSGGEAELFQADIREEVEVAKMFEFIKNKWEGLDILVNNAGVDIEAEIEHCDYELWRKILDINLTGKFLCTKHAIPLLKMSDYPSIINIASRMGSKPVTEIVPYCTAEAGVIMLTKGCALELAKYKIRVNTISPGLTRTPLTEKLCDEEFFETYAERNPMKRLGTSEDISNVVLFLVSKEAEYIHGENIDVSGGILLK